jgi:hypothetical protein
VDTEPVRLTGWTALVVGLALNAIVLWSLDTPVKAIAGGTAVLALSVIGGLEWARTKAWAPQSHREKVQQATERGFDAGIADRRI